LIHFAERILRAAIFTKRRQLLLAAFFI